MLSPDETHSRFVAKAIRADKHILLEKPPCITVREIDELLALKAACGYAKTLFVAYMRRYADAFLAAKAELPDRADITHVRIYDLITVGTQFLNRARPSSTPRTSTLACSPKAPRRTRHCCAR